MDLSAYGQTDDFTFTSGLQYIRQLGFFLFSPATITSGIEFNGSNLVDNKLGYFDFEENAHYGNTLVADQQVYTKAAFLQSEWKMDKLVLTSGLRYDHYLISDNINDNDEVSGNVFSPRISLLYNLSEHF